MLDKKTEKILKVSKLIIWAVPLILLIWVLGQHLSLSGVFKVRYNTVKGSKSKLIKNFASKERFKLLASENQSGAKPEFQLITTSPVYFSVKVPRPFARAKVILKYKNLDKQPVIKLGVKQANGAYYYKDLAVSLPILENLPEYWQPMRSGNLVLWQKDKDFYNAYLKNKKELDQKWEDRLKQRYGDKLYSQLTAHDKMEIISRQHSSQEYKEELKNALEKSKNELKSGLAFKSLGSFLESLPDINKILQYNYPIISHQELPGYEKKLSRTEITKSLRGPHKIVVYLGRGEDFDFSFVIQDINRSQGKDEFKVEVYDMTGKKVGKANLADDGITEASEKVKPEREVNLSIKDLPVGVYQLVISCNDDIFIKKISTKQHLLMFKGGIYFAESNEYKSILGNKKLSQTNIYAKGNLLKAQTSHLSGLQTVQVGKKAFRLSAIGLPISVKMDKNLIYNVRLLKNDVKLSGDVFFAFEKSQFFDPNFGQASSIKDSVDIDNYDFIIANYPKPKDDKGWLVAEAEVEVPVLYFEKGKDLLANFIISLPGLPEAHRTLQIKEISIEFNKDPVTFSNLIPKIKNHFKK